MHKTHQRSSRQVPAQRADLALVVIARNESRCIARCLQSVGNGVSRVVVLDTGSTDDTVAIAKSCGAQVHHAAWTDDFSTARNRALELAQADWNLFLDADEWIESGAECLYTATLQEPFVGLVVVRSDLGLASGPGEGRSWLPRLLPRGVRYEGRIHEQPVHELPERHLPLVLGHDGYLAEQHAKKRGRNRRMLEREIRQQPGNPYIAYQLGKELEIVQDFPGAADHYLRALSLSRPGLVWRRRASARLVYCLAQSRHYEQAIIHSSDMMEECASSTDFFFALGNLFLDLAVAHPEQSTDQWLPMAESAWLRCLEIGERPEQDCVVGRGSFLAAQNLSVLYEGTGNSAKARHYSDLAKKTR